jgi:hypothetical protein
MTATDDRGPSDYQRAKFEPRDIHQQRELVDRNLMKLPGRGRFAGCWTSKSWGKLKGGRDVQETLFLCRFTIKLLLFLAKARKIFDFLLKHRDLNAIGSQSDCQAESSPFQNF